MQWFVLMEIDENSWKTSETKIGIVVKRTFDVILYKKNQHIKPSANGGLASSSPELNGVKCLIFEWVKARTSGI